MFGVQSPHNGCTSAQQRTQNDRFFSDIQPAYSQKGVGTGARSTAKQRRPAKTEKQALISGLQYFAFAGQAVFSTNGIEKARRHGLSAMLPCKHSFASLWVDVKTRRFLSFRPARAVAA